MGQYRPGQLVEVISKYRGRGFSVMFPVFGFVTGDEDGPYIEPLFMIQHYELIQSERKCVRDHIMDEVDRKLYEAVTSFNRIF